jgi:hypothetical protein
VQGTRREVLRALCQVVNTTELTLEACLVDIEDGDWHLVAARAGKGMDGGAWPACLPACLPACKGACSWMTALLWFHAQCGSWGSAE